MNAITLYENFNSLKLLVLATDEHKLILLLCVHQRSSVALSKNDGMAQIITGKTCYIEDFFFII
jgi:hypothetical protein